MSALRLNWSEVRFAAEVGITRQIQNLRNGRRDVYGASPDDGWRYHVEGALGELVVAKQLGRYWAGNLAGLDYAGDVGPGTQVRSTSRPEGCLIVYERDANDAIFWLVTGRPPMFTVAGWIRAGEAKRPCYWRTQAREPAYFVPAQALNRPGVTE